MNSFGPFGDNSPLPNDGTVKGSLPKAGPNTLYNTCIEETKQGQNVALPFPQNIYIFKVILYQF